MSTRRAKKLQAEATAVVAAVDDSEENAKTTKVTAKKTKVVKASKQPEQNDVASNGDTKSKKAAPKKNVKPVEQSADDDDDDAGAATTKATKKATSKKAVKKNEVDENVEPKNSVPDVTKESKSKKAAPKKTAESKNAVEVAEPNNSTSKDNTKASVRGRKKKIEAVEEKVLVETKAPKRGAKKNEAIDEAGPSKLNKKSTKTTKEDDIDDVQANSSEPQAKRRVKKVQSPEKPVEIEKPAKGRAKKAADTKSKTNATESNDEPKPAKGNRKPGKVLPVKSQSPPKKPRTEVNDSAADTVDGPFASKPNGTPRKRKADAPTADSTTNDGTDDLVTKRKKPAKETKETATKSKMNPTATDISQINFDTDKEFTHKIVSWNVAGLRAVIGKGGFEYFEHEKPDIICLQEIKCLEEEVPEEAKLKGYHPYWCSTPGGRGGVAILSKSMPYNVEKNIGNEEMDEEGRIITAEYSKYFLVNVYVPNAGRKLVNLDRRLRWNKLFEEHVNKLKAKKPVIICGDMNVSHSEIDLANPKTNRKNAGFSDEERAGMTDLLAHGFVDTFRELYPNQEKAYTFWTYMGNARSKNVGWRLDYAIVSENLKSKVVDNFMRPQVLGSDHCPIVLLMAM